jgi:hypothetical protein
VRNHKLLQLYEQCCEYGLNPEQFKHIPRAQNARADELANLAIKK